MSAVRKLSARRTGHLARLRGVLLGFLFGRPVDEDTSDRLSEIKGLILIGLSLWLFISLVSFHTPPHEEAAGALRPLDGSEADPAP